MTDFEATILALADEAGLKVAETSDTAALFLFAMKSGRQEEVALAAVEGGVGFYAASFLSAESEAEISPALRLALEQRNLQLKVGAWSVAPFDDALVLTVAAAVADADLDAEAFKNVIFALVDECDDFEGAVEAAQEPPPPPSAAAAVAGRSRAGTPPSRGRRKPSAGLQAWAALFGALGARLDTLLASPCPACGKAAWAGARLHRPTTLWERLVAHPPLRCRHCRQAVLLGA